MSYESKYENYASSQKCAAARVIQEMNSDSTLVENDYKMEFKFGTEYAVKNGWRLWSSLYANEEDSGADGTPFTVIVHELSNAITVVVFTTFVILNTF